MASLLDVLFLWLRLDSYLVSVLLRSYHSQQERRDHERQAEERAALVARCKDRLAGLDTAPIEKLREDAAAALNAYVVCGEDGCVQ